MIVLSLPYPPSVNHYWDHTVIMSKGKRPRAIRYLSKRAKKYRTRIEEMVREQLGEPPNLKDRLAVIVHEHYGPDGKPQDIDNCLKPLFDSLEHAGVYANDSQIDQLLVLKKRRAAVGRVDVTIRIIGEP